MINKVLKFIDDYKLANKTIVVGFSGGYDSMCLLDILDKFSEQLKIKLIAAHYNHNWRGKIARQEQEHCRQFCFDRNIEFYTETAPDDIKKNETEAREQRYAFFERAKLKFNADIVCTAHNYDDNAETILYRIIKGTGIVGLKGIIPVREYYYRPLLNVTRSEIEEYNKLNGLNPNNDESNYDSIHKRNLIRYEILPLLQKINPEVKKSLNSLSSIAQSECNILDECMKNVSERLFNNGKILTKEYLKLSGDLQQKIIYNLIYNSEIDYNMSLVKNIVNFIQECSDKNKPSKFSLSTDKWLYVDKNIIEIISETIKTNFELKVEGEGIYQFNNDTFMIKTTNESFDKMQDEYSALVDLSCCEDLVLRTRRDGDVIKPLGSNGTMKLKKYLMSKNIPQHVRDNLVLLCQDKEVLWVAGVGLSDRIKTIDKPTHRISIKYNKEVLL